MLFLILFMSVGATRVCKTFPDYYTNENCYDDPDGEREVVSYCVYVNIQKKYFMNVVKAGNNPKSWLPRRAL